jgi:purine-nucleoside/S-methyl-5'-thioadenosine phosphorylase / adenosine deaminase
VNIEWLTPQWPVPPAVGALSTLRGGGVSLSPYASLNLGAHVGDEPAAVLDNRRRLRVAAELPAEPAWLSQVHGARVLDLDAPGALGGGASDGGAFDVDGVLGPADAAVTRRPGRICAILAADCLPVLFAADSGEAVGAAHAGWRGLAGGVIEATVQALGVPASTLLAWLGPAIGARHFEIGPEVRDALLKGDAGAEAAFTVNARGRFMADLGALARRRLARLGIERTYGGGECTYSQSAKYFSHRRDGRTGRQASLIWLRKGASR